MAKKQEPKKSFLSNIKKTILKNIVNHPEPKKPVKKSAAAPVKKPAAKKEAPKKAEAKKPAAKKQINKPVAKKAADVKKPAPAKIETPKVPEKKVPVVNQVVKSTAKKISPAKEPSSGKDAKKSSKDAKPTNEAQEDTVKAALKKALLKGKEKGFVTFDDVNRLLPADKFAPEIIDDFLAKLQDANVQVVESGEDALTKGENEEEEEKKEDNLGKTDDPVRLYLREMGGVELLSREGEIEIAKRIEENRDKMLSGLFETPQALRTLMKWRDELFEGKLLLRNFLDLDATYGAGPGNIVEVDHAAIADQKEAELDRKEREKALKKKSKSAADEEEEEEEEEEEVAVDDSADDFDDANVSLAAMEEKLIPIVRESLDKAADAAKALLKIQDAKLEAVLDNAPLEEKHLKKYEKQKTELLEALKELRFDGTVIDKLLQELYSMNREIIAVEGDLMRVAEKHKVKRLLFLEQYAGNELNKNWLKKIAKLGKGWAEFADKEKDYYTKTQERLREMAHKIGLDVGCLLYTSPSPRDH
jgi:RNA polymerase primary sigma factor